MKFDKLYAGLALAIAAGSAQAYSPTTSHDITLRIGGASAQDANLEALIYNDLCVADANRDRYSFNNSNTSYRAVSCTTKTGVSGLPANKKLLVIKRSAGGSGYGVVPLIAANPADGEIDFLRVTSGCSAGSTVAGYTYNCTQLEKMPANAGISDVEPELFIEANIPADFQNVVFDRTKPMTVKPAASLVFGLAVSKNLRDEMQRQLIDAGKLAGCAVGDETEACMVSFTKQQAASILSGSMLDWQQLTINGADIFNTAVNNNTGPASGSSTIKICRREDGSGTQAANNAAILHYPCGPAAIPPASTSGTGSQVVENNAAGNLDNCLSDTQNWAFGFQTSERNVNRSLNYRFVKVDGVAPTLENVWNGKYFYHAEQTIQWLNSESADVKNIMNVIAANTASPTRTAARNAAFVHSFGPSGYLSLVSNGNTADPVWTNDPVTKTSLNPTTPYQHVFGGNLSNCRVPTIDPASLGAIE